jgi:TonB family protein
MKGDPLAWPMEREERFGRNLLIILAVHVAVIGAVWLVDRLWRKAPEQIIWLDGGGELGAPAPAPQGAATKASGKAEREIPTPPAPVKSSPPPPVAESPPKPPTPPPQPPSELAEKKATPAPTPKPTPKPEVKPKPESTPPPKPPTPEPKKEVKATPKPAPKATPKPAAQVAKTATPKPASKPADVATPKPAVTREGATGTGAVNSAAKTGSGHAKEAGEGRQALRGKYGDIVGGRFIAAGAPRKPTSVEGNNQEYTVLMRFKIARDGSVVSAVVVTPCGNRLVDEWIVATIPDFQRVPPPPEQLLRDGVYEDLMEVIYTL